MGLFDKIKGILFDEEVVDVPINSDELPEREPKKVTTEEVRGFRDYHSEENTEEDTIKEVVIPKEEVKVEEEDKPERTFNMPIDFEMEEELPLRSRVTSDEDTLEYRIDRPEREVVKVIETPRRNEEVKDYKKIISEKEETTFKKPFRVTPIISPVYGILDKNYTPDEVVERRESINRINNNVTRPRTFGPVSYNDQPLPKARVSEVNNLKEELVELNTTISELIEDSVNESPSHPSVEITRTEVIVSEPNRVIEQVTEETVYNPVIEEEVVQIPEEEDIVIQTPNYDELETSGIENEYIGNNNIEDAFESTSEFNRINETDLQEEKAEPPISIEEIINNPDSLDNEEDHLDDTIETDLFNLIDSMYRHDEDDDEALDSEE